MQANRLINIARRLQRAGYISKVVDIDNANTVNAYKMKAINMGYDDNQVECHAGSHAELKEDGSFLATDECKDGGKEIFSAFKCAGPKGAYCSSVSLCAAQSRFNSTTLVGPRKTGP